MADLPAVLGVDGSGKSLLERHRFLSVRGKTAHLDAVGEYVRDNYARLVRNVESDWEARFGPSVAAARRALESVLPALDPSLPDAMIETHLRS